jgi:uncharacterized membrane protein YedE/YeeE
MSVTLVRTVSYGNWTDWLLCLGIIILLEVRLPSMSNRNPSGHSPRYWRRHPEYKPQVAALPPKAKTQLPIWSAISFILGHLWSWWVIAPLVFLLLGAAVNAMYSNDYIAAAVLFFVAVVLLVAKSLTADETREHENRVAISMLVVVLGATLFGLSLVWNRHVHGKLEARFSPAKTTQPIPSASSTDWLARFTSPPTIGDVFLNDFPTTLRLHDEGEFHWKDINTVTHLKRQLYLDFPANSKFVGFYIPTTDPTDLTRTFEICINLVRRDLVQQALSELPKKTFIAAGLGQTTTIQDLTFSGRVVIYHDDLLSITQQADITRAFAEKHYAVGFFGPNDFGKTLSSWHHLHDTKAAN